MARIFYWTAEQKDEFARVIAAEGDIYGVHPDGNIDVPDEVGFIDVPGSPNDIPWPVTPDGPGSEKWSRVNPVTKTVELNPLKVPPSERQQAERALKKDPVWRAMVRRELATRRAAGESTLTAQEIIDEIKSALP